RRAGPSAPLDEPCSVVPDTLRHDHRASQARPVIWEPGHVVSGSCASMVAMAAPAPIHLVVGEEELLVERAIERVVAEVRAADPSAEVRRVRAAELTPADLAESLSPSLFAEGRVLVLLAAQEVGKELAAAIVEHAADPAEGTVLVVVHSGGARNKGMVDALRK